MRKIRPTSVFIRYQKYLRFFLDPRVTLCQVSWSFLKNHSSLRSKVYDTTLPKTYVLRWRSKKGSILPMVSTLKEMQVKKLLSTPRELQEFVGVVANDCGYSMLFRVQPRPSHALGRKHKPPLRTPVSPQSSKSPNADIMFVRSAS